MAVGRYYQTILDTLQGQTDDLRALPPDRLDWAGPGALLDLYRKTSGNDREALIRAIGQVIENHPASPAVIAPLVNIASALDISQVEPQVRRLQADPFASEELMRGAITNFLAFRQLRARPEPVKARRATDGKPKSRKGRSGRGALSESVKGNASARRKSAGT